MVLLIDIRGVVEDVVCIDIDEEGDTSEKDVTENNDLNYDWRRGNDFEKERVRQVIQKRALK